MLAQFVGEGFGAEQVALAWSADLRFRGQASEIRLPLPLAQLALPAIAALHAAFEDEHERLYGHRSDPDNPLEIVALRLIGRVGAQAEIAALQPIERSVVTTASRLAYFGVRWGAVETPVVPRRALAGGAAGPLLIDEYDSTIVVPPEARALLDGDGNVVIERVTR